MSPNFKMPNWLNQINPRNRRLINDRLQANPELQKAREQCLQLKKAEILNHTIAETRFVVMDTETTGFGVYSGDEIVSIAMIEMQGLELTGKKFDSLVNPQRPIPELSTTIHGITDHDVKDAPTLEELIADILNFIDHAVIVGHHTLFDLRFINKNLKRLLGCQLKNPWIDTMLLHLSYSGRMGHYSLEEVAQYCKVELTERHTAYGDALIAAKIFHTLTQQLTEPHQPVSHLIHQQQTVENTPQV